MSPSIDPTQPAPPRFVVVSPTYNNVGTLVGVLEGLRALGLAILVVNDGSTDGSRGALEAWRAAEPASRFVITHEINRGKAAALLTGFAWARESGFTHALTIDSDAQHAPEDLRVLMARAVEEPGALVVGARPGGVAGCPWASRIGRFVSNHLVWVSSGLGVADSQSGMRCYPLGVVGGLGARASRYAFETEIIVRAAWAGVRIVEVPISGMYQVPGGRVTHFRKGRDSWGSLCLHARLISRSMLPGDPVPRVDTTRPRDPAIGTILHRAGWWLGPRRLMLMVRGDVRARERFAASVATGFFMATVPLYGIKTATCLWLSARFRLHPAVVIAISSLSTPPLGFVFLFPSVVVGYLLLHGDSPTALPGWSTVTLADIRALLAEWIVGSLVVGAVLAMLSYVLARLMLRLPALRST